MAGEPCDLIPKGATESLWYRLGHDTALGVPAPFLLNQNMWSQRTFELSDTPTPTSSACSMTVLPRPRTPRGTLLPDTVRLL